MIKRILNSKRAFTVFFAACLIFYGVSWIIKPSIEDLLYVALLGAAIVLRWTL